MLQQNSEVIVPSNLKSILRLSRLSLHIARDGFGAVLQISPLNAVLQIGINKKNGKLFAFL